MSLNHSDIYTAWEPKRHVDTLLRLEVATEFDYDHLCWTDDTTGVLDNLDWAEGYPELQDILRISFDSYSEDLASLHLFNRAYEMRYA